MGASVRSVALTGSDQAVSATACEFAGFVIAETGASTGSVRIYDNASAASGTLIGAANFTSGSVSVMTLTRPVWCVNGIYVDIVSGTLAGSVLVA